MDQNQTSSQPSDQPESAQQTPVVVKSSVLPGTVNEGPTAQEMQDIGLQLQQLESTTFNEPVSADTSTATEPMADSVVASPMPITTPEAAPVAPSETTIVTEAAEMVQAALPEMPATSAACCMAAKPAALPPV